MRFAPASGRFRSLEVLILISVCLVTLAGGAAAASAQFASKTIGTGR